MKLSLLLIFLTVTTNLLADDLYKKFESKGCNLINSSWKITKKVDEGIYEYKIGGNRYAPPKIGNLVLASLEFKTPGPIRVPIFVEKTATRKAKNSKGFDVTIPIYQESTKCKEIWFNNFTIGQLLDLSYPKMPELENSIRKKWKNNEKNQNKKNEEQAKAKKREIEKRSIKRKKENKELNKLFE